MALKILHTADWHLGRLFPSFRPLDQPKLSQARLAAVGTLLGIAARHQVDAVLCAGDLFDSDRPTEEYWKRLTKLLAEQEPTRPVFLLPGNHDPLRPGSVYSLEHPFRALLPKWVHVVDRDDFEYALSPEAVLLAVPCRSQAGSEDPTRKLPARPHGDTRIRIGMVHGQTFDLKTCQANFPISKTAASELGLDYLALGDTHSFRQVLTGPPPVVYPGAPEATDFEEQEPGKVALVFFPRRPRPLRIQAETVAGYSWEHVRVGSIEELRGVAARVDLGRRVLQLTLNLTVSLDEQLELDALLGELGGTDAAAGRAAALRVTWERVEVDTRGIDALVPELPPVLQRTVQRLQALEREAGPEAAKAAQALRHLYQVLKRTGAAA